MNAVALAELAVDQVVEVAERHLEGAVRVLVVVADGRRVGVAVDIDDALVGAGNSHGCCRSDDCAAPSFIFAVISCKVIGEFLRPIAPWGTYLTPQNVNSGRMNGRSAQVDVTASVSGCRSVGRPDRHRHRRRQWHRPLHCPRMQVGRARRHHRPCRRSSPREGRGLVRWRYLRDARLRHPLLEEAQVREAIAAVVAKNGRVHGLFNNAGGQFCPAAA